MPGRQVLMLICVCLVEEIRMLFVQLLQMAIDVSREFLEHVPVLFRLQVLTLRIESAPDRVDRLLGGGAQLVLRLHAYLPIRTELSPGKNKLIIHNRTTITTMTFMIVLIWGCIGINELTSQSTTPMITSRRISSRMGIRSSVHCTCCFASGSSNTTSGTSTRSALTVPTR